MLFFPEVGCASEICNSKMEVIFEIYREAYEQRGWLQKSERYYKVQVTHGGQLCGLPTPDMHCVWLCVGTFPFSCFYSQNSLSPLLGL